MDEAFRVGDISVVEHRLAQIANLFSRLIMHHLRRHHADPRVPMHPVVPREKRMAKRLAVLEATEPVRERWPILHRLKLALRIRIVVGGVRATVGLRHAKIGKEEHYRFGTHRRTAIGMETPRSRGVPPSSRQRND